ncbi:MAG: Rv2578c family radical SAM protein, partial [Actinomycetota bacterium]
PDLVPRYEEMYARSAYGPKKDRDALGRMVGGFVAAAGGIKRSRHISERCSPEPRKEPRARQLRLI